MSIGWKVHSTILTRRHILPCQAFALTKLKTTKVYIASHCPVPIEKETVTLHLYWKAFSHTPIDVHLTDFFFQTVGYINESLKYGGLKTRKFLLLSGFRTCIWICHSHLKWVCCLMWMAINVWRSIQKVRTHGSEVIRKWFGVCNTPFPKFAVESPCHFAIIYYANV